MEITIRDVRQEDMKFVTELNRVNVEVLSPMDGDRFLYFMKNSEMFQVAEADGTPAAFLIALREGIPDYTSENYIWFSRQYSSFLYVDRIVIDERFRGLGLGRMLYGRVFAHAEETKAGIVTAEIDTMPYNETSLAFHQAMGFQEVGTQVIRGGEVTVSLQAHTLA